MFQGWSHPPSIDRSLLWSWFWCVRKVACLGSLGWGALVGEPWWRWLVQVLPPVERHGSGAWRQQRVRNTSQGRLKELLNPFCVLVISRQAGATLLS